MHLNKSHPLNTLCKCLFNNSAANTPIHTCINLTQGISKQHEQSERSFPSVLVLISATVSRGCIKADYPGPRKGTLSHHKEGDCPLSPPTPTIPPDYYDDVSVLCFLQNHIKSFPGPSSPYFSLSVGVGVQARPPLHQRYIYTSKKGRAFCLLETAKLL